MTKGAFWGLYEINASNGMLPMFNDWSAALDANLLPHSIF